MIDIHTHLGFHKIYPQQYLGGMLVDQMREDPKTKKLIKLFLNDSDGSKHLRAMDHAGINKSALLIIDGGIGIQEPEMSIEEIHKLHYNILKNHEDRFIVFAGVDPRRGKRGVELFKKSIEEYGFRGLKLYPPMGYSLHDERLHDYYDLCDKHKLGILIHTGPSLNFLKNEYADAKYVIPLAKKYSNALFILAHAGYQLNQSSIGELLNIENVYFDIAGIQPMCDTSSSDHIELFKKVFEPKYNTKIVYGSDWPLFNLTSSLSKHLSAITEMKNVLKINDNLLNNIMVSNACDIVNYINS